MTVIPADGYGEVLVHRGGKPVKLAVKSQVPAARGTEVGVEEALSQPVVSVHLVERWPTALPQTPGTDPAMPLGLGKWSVNGQHRVYSTRQPTVPG
ncbi:hypothetical protein ACIBAG_28030 [Streptomyces sp. NPDC051243]|uniref:hypothetical protein n=1 Tax=Streptomyces sp. NPDC051243 TaxID=3365646 RepID=UPI0037BC7678